jgi:cytochrome P450
MATAMRRLTLEILAETVFDVEVATEAAEAGDIVDQIMDDFNRRVATRSPLPVVLPTLGNLRLLRSLRRLDHLLDGIIDDRRRRGAPGEDLLSRLVRTPGGDGHALTNEEVKLTALPLFFAGHETTAMTLTWTLYLLTRYPEVRQRVLDELDTVLGGRPATNADVRNLPQLGNVVHESLRLYPPGWAFGRMAVRDTRVGPYRVPARTTIFMSPWLLHRDERLYERPLEFDPERWSDGLAHRLHRCAYIPFSTGPRRCPGNTFATVESVVVLATICRRWNFTYEGEDEPVLDPSITLRPRDGLLLRVAGAVDRAA